MLRRAAHAHGCTINDLLIAAVTAGLRDLLDLRGENRDSLELLASVPVGARAGTEGGMFIARLPVGVPDADERLRIIRQATAKGKGSPDQGVAGIVVLPASLARLGVAWARRAAASHVNLYVTNVPGPPSALYCAGARLLEAVPLAPLVAGVRLSVTALYLRRPACGIPARRRQHGRYAGTRRRCMRRVRRLYQVAGRLLG